jgi:hypothetical protein
MSHLKLLFRVYNIFAEERYRQGRFYAGARGPRPPSCCSGPQFPLTLFPDGTGLPAIGWEVGTRPPRIFGLEPRLATALQHDSGSRQCID